MSTSTSTALQKATTSAIDKAKAEVNRVLESCTMDRIIAMPAFDQAIVLATGYKALRAALTDEIMQELFMPLCGTKLGFRTDLDSKEKGYSVHIVRECVIDAMIQGARPVGNEFNIIADQAYFTKEFFERKIQELEGLTDVIDEPGVPQMAGDRGALVPYILKYTYKGTRGQIVRGISTDKDGVATDTRICVRVNSGQGADAILGKAKRKIYCQLYKRLTGSKISDGDVDVIDTTGESVPDHAKPPNEQKAGTTAQVDELYEKHKKQGAATKNGKTEESPPAQPDTAGQQAIPNT